MAYTNATFFIDFEGGSDAARTSLTSCTASNPSGSTTRINKTSHGLVTGAVVDLTLFSTWLNEAWKITVVDNDNFDLDGAVWQTTADASGTVTPRGGSSKADAWLTITSGATSARHAAGDTIRMMASRQGSLGINGTWTDGPRENTKSIGSSTNATPIVVTINSHGYSNGDTVIVASHTTNTNANGVWEVANVATNTFELVNADGSNSIGNGAGGATGTVRRVNNARVWLASSLTKNVAIYGNQGSSTKGNWTASANVTCAAYTTSWKEGYSAQEFQIGASFTTGLAAYFALGSAVDFSSYQQLSFKVNCSTTAMDFSICLCSDTAGATPVDTFTYTTANQGSTGFWFSLTIDKGSALGSSIQSVALYINTDNGAQNIRLDNIIACKAVSSADALSLASCIGKATANETYWPIQSINGQRVMLETGMSTVPSTSPSRGYSGTTETVTTHHIQTIRSPTVSSSQTIQRSGTSGSLITYSGGWDRTNMTSQTGETWLAQNSTSVSTLAYDTSFNAITKLGLTYGVSGLGSYGQPAAGTLSLTNVTCAANNGNGFSGGTTTSGWLMTSSSCFGIANQSSGISWSQDAELINFYAMGNSTHGVSLATGPGGVITGPVVAKNNGSYGIQASATAGQLVINGITTSGNVSGGLIPVGGSLVHSRGASIGESTEVSATAPQQYTGWWSMDHDGVAGVHKIYRYGATIDSETSVRHTASGLAWKISITNSARDSTFPLIFEIARIAVKASTLVTVKLWMRRTNTGLTHKLVCKGGQIGGVAADVTSSVTAAADTWEEVTITFTPNEAGVVIITTETYGGTTYSGYVDDFSVSQA